MGQTDNHSYPIPDAGDSDYENTFNSYFDQVDETVPIVDTDGNETNYTPYDGALFIASDTGTVYRGDGNAWNELRAPEQTTVSKSSAYTANNREKVLADASGSAFTITLPAPEDDIHVTIKKTDASNDVTIATPNNETIDGNSNITLSTQYVSRTITSDGSDYFII